jgi:hypothetical protein
MLLGRGVRPSTLCLPESMCVNDKPAQGPSRYTSWTKVDKWSIVNRRHA